MPYSEITKLRDSEYIEMYAELENNKIDTTKLVFVEFVSQINEQSKPSFINGVLVFSYKGKKYGLANIAVQVAPNGYKLISIGSKLLK